VGERQEDEFPLDYGRVDTDVFCIALAHEYAHNIDSTVVKADPILQGFRERLLHMAGRSRDNYLRATIEDGYFAGNPAEFFASIGNQYYCSSEDTFTHALRKLRQGNVNQINQFVLFASTIAGEQEVTFYRIGTDGVVRSSRYPVTKHNGLLTSLRKDGVTYHFSYGEGTVRAVGTE
jgi:hypothetical protein